MIVAYPGTTTATPAKVKFDTRQMAGTATPMSIDFIGEVIGPRTARPVMQISSLPPGRPTFKISVAQEDGLWMIADEPTGIHGCGDTVAAALADFQQATREHLDLLERQPALAGPLRQQLSYLRARVI